MDLDKISEQLRQAKVFTKRFREINEEVLRVAKKDAQRGVDIIYSPWRPEFFW